jgi:hypothetical protein
MGFIKEKGTAGKDAGRKELSHRSSEATVELSTALPQETKNRPTSQPCHATLGPVS